MPTFFCAETVQLSDPLHAIFTYNGYLCVGTDPMGKNGTPQAATKTFATPLQNVDAQDQTPTCNCGPGSPCPHAIPARIITKKDLHKLKFVTLYAAGVPNPNNPWNHPDDPVQNPYERVIAEYTADFLLGKKRYQARLLQIAYEKDKVKAVWGVAYVIDRRSPPSPSWIPNFSGKKGWVKLSLKPQPVLKVLHVGTFDLQVIS